jgi:predicted GH43/DUF377 family glycosyl hydrolase
MVAFQLERLGLIIDPEPGNPYELEGILNPAAVRGRDGELYLFPRLVAAGNYSRIGIARVRFDERGDPAGIERLGVALEPEADYERRAGGGGCEDPRITFVKGIQRYVMTYTALSDRGPRIAIATSEDLLRWERVGLAAFMPHGHVQFQGVDNKDGAIFPVRIPNANGEPSVAILHRPLFPGTRPEEIGERLYPETRAQGIGHEPVDKERESIWISYCSIGHGPDGKLAHREICHFGSHHRLASPVADWELVKIGTGAPPVLTRFGWLLVYHGVCELPEHTGAHRFRYSAGVMVLSQDHPQEIVYRSPEPVLTPSSQYELRGAVPNVVFPTGIDRRDDIDQPERFDVYYGMADDSIGVAKLVLPDELPSHPPAARDAATTR